MSGIILAALAGLLTPQAAPHPSTQALYTAPVIRPFEPASDFGSEVAAGDVAPPPHRAPLTAPVTVDAYDGAYEVTPTDAEAAYEQGVDSAEIRADQAARSSSQFPWPSQRPPVATTKVRSTRTRIRSS